MKLLFLKQTPKIKSYKLSNKNILLRESGKIDSYNIFF